MTNTFETDHSQRALIADLDRDLTLTERRKQWQEIVFAALVRGFAVVTVGLMFWMAWVITKDAQPAIQQYGLAFLWDRDWDIREQQFGALPFIYGTLVSSAIALVLAVPVGLSVAVITSEDVLPTWLRGTLGFLVELIAAIPSVIVGLWGIFVLIPYLKPFQQWLYQHLGWIPLFSTEPLGPGMLTAGILLSVMILPTIAAISRDVLLAVPSELRSASMSLGATRWETIWRILLPVSSSGVIGAVMLALGRALGETMAVTMVIGNSIQISPSLLAPGYTIPAVLANQFAEALDVQHIGALMYLALVLFAITLLVNFVAVLLVQVLGRKAISSENS